jgi:hypothetical protein
MINISINPAQAKEEVPRIRELFPITTLKNASHKGRKSSAFLNSILREGLCPVWVLNNLKEERLKMG